jgi:hypothetical protein
MGDSLEQCGGSGKVYNFLLAGDAAPGLMVYEILTVVTTIGVAAAQCFFVRIAAARGGEWERSRNALFLSWILPSAFMYMQYIFPNEKVFFIDYEARADQAVMMPYVSSDPESCKFDMCTAAHLCGLQLNVQKLAIENLKDLFRPITCRIPFVDIDVLFQYIQEMDFPGDTCFQYDTQVLANTLTIRVGDSGSFFVSEMMDTLDLLMAVLVGTDLGEVAATAVQVTSKFGQFLETMVRAKISFNCLSALAPLALSLLPALQQAAYAAKQVFPQDPFIGWIVRAVPLLAVPLHAVFIFLIGQMFSDWFVCFACIFLIIGMSAVTIFGAGITPPDTEARNVVDAYKAAKKKGLIFNVLAGLCLVAAVATNDLISQAVRTTTATSAPPLWPIF